MAVAGARGIVQRLLGTRMGQAMLAPATKEAAKASVPGAILNTALTGMSGGGIPAALATGGLDVGLSTAGARLAGKVTPETILKLTGDGAKRKAIANLLAKAEPGQMTTLQSLGMGAGSVAASMATLPLYPSQQVLNLSPQQVQQSIADPSAVDPDATMDQQLAQRQYINQLQSQLLSPNTMFQMQGLPQASIDPYGLSRGQL